jgi:hypothetical protein
VKSSLNLIVQKADKAVRHLIEQCHKDGPLYQSNPKAVAQVNRTGKWFLNALAQLQKEPSAQEDKS